MLLIFIGCAADTMSQAWQLDRLRILGAQINPPEAHPGSTVEFKSLVYAPKEQPLETVIWFACLGENASSFGCNIDPSVIESNDIAALEEAGFAGLEPEQFPFGTPHWNIPDDALNSLEEDEKQEGVSGFVNVTAIPETATQAEESQSFQDSTQQDQLEIAYKRFPISESPNPNTNPTLIGFKVDDVEYTSFSAQAGETYSIEPILSADSIETYTYTPPDSDPESREEEPYFTWYTEGGLFFQEYSLHPFSTVEWTAPPAPWTGTIITVVRDRRGGMDWSWLTVDVEN